MTLQSEEAEALVHNAPAMDDRLVKFVARHASLDDVQARAAIDAIRMWNSSQQDPDSEENSEEAVPPIDQDWELFDALDLISSTIERNLDRWNAQLDALDRGEARHLETA